MDLVGVVLSWAKARTRGAGQGPEESVRMGKVGVTAGSCCTHGQSGSQTLAISDPTRNDERGIGKCFFDVWQ
jgi:hypothetical protein